MILSLFWRKPDFLQADDVIIAELACDVVCDRLLDLSPVEDINEGSGVALPGKIFEIIGKHAHGKEKLIVLFKGFLMQKGFGENPAVACE